MCYNYSMNNNLKTWISNTLITSAGGVNGQRYVSKKFIEENKVLIDQFERRVSFLKDAKLNEKVYCVLNDISSKPTCECSKPLKYLVFDKRYSMYCNSKCRYKAMNAVTNAKTLKKREKLLKEREKLLNMPLKEFIANNCYRNDILYHNNLSSNEIMREKLINETSFINHINPSLIERMLYVVNDIKEPVTCKNKECNNIIHISKKSLNKYCSYKCNNVCKENRNKRSGTLRSTLTDKFSYQNMEEYDNDTWWYDNSKNDIMKFETSYLCEYFNTTTSTVLKRMRLLGIKPLPVKISKEEQEIVDFIKSISNKKVVQSDRSIITPREIDIYIPDSNLAIEHNGIYWHSFDDKVKESRLKNKHLEKTKDCEDADIQLLHIFGNEWLEKSKIWKSVIKNKLGLSDRIYARKCTIKEVSNKDTEYFLNNNHLQGSVMSKYNYGLYYNNELVSIITFSKSRYNKNVDYELIRFCSKLNTTIVGGFSKLLKHFRRLHKGSIISYANRRWSNGNLYEKNGFDFISDTTPNYFYTKDSNLLESRVKYQKHKLKEILDNYDSNLTETENMYNNGYRKIYDSGNKVYILNN